MKAKVNVEFQIGFWTDPDDGQRKQVFIPVVWLEYANGSTEMIDIEGMTKENEITKFPLGPISFKERQS